MPGSMEKANEMGTGRIGHFVIIMTLISIVEEIGPLYATGSRTDPSCRAIRFLKNSLFSIAAPIQVMVITSGILIKEVFKRGTTGEKRLTHNGRGEVAIRLGKTEAGEAMGILSVSASFSPVEISDFLSALMSNRITAEQLKAISKKYPLAFDDETFSIKPPRSDGFMQRWAKDKERLRRSMRRKSR